MGRLCNESVADVDLIEASIDDPASLDNMTSSTVILLAAAGPFDIMGTPIVDSCLRSATHYLDITGETQWVRKIIDKHHNAASEKKLKIVPCCGFDCIPSDMACYFMVSQMKLRNLEPMEVRFILGDVKGSFSNGTASTMIHLFASSSIKSLLQLLNPYYLNPLHPNGSLAVPRDKRTVWNAADTNTPGYDSKFGFWTMPYIMQGVDCRIVNRSNSVGGWHYGEKFVFTERMKVGGVISAVLGSIMVAITGLLLMLPFTRPVIKACISRPGQGPSEAVQQTGFFRIKLWGVGRNRATGLEEVITGGIDAMQGDPGYLQCSRMVSEAALSLLSDTKKETAGDIYGVITPSLAFKDDLLKRLHTIGMKFYVDEKN